MTNDLDPKNGQTWWITSLAISIICCAVFFVVFAGYIFGVKEAQGIAAVRLEVMENRLNAMNNELDFFRRKNMVQQIQIISQPGAQQMPVGQIIPLVTDQATPTTFPPNQMAPILPDSQVAVPPTVTAPPPAPVVVPPAIPAGQSGAALKK